MEHLLLEIEKALQNEEYFIALFCTLTLPDICAALENKDGKTTKTLYKAWYEKNMIDPKSLNAEQCYSFRCKMLHQGLSSYKSDRGKKRSSEPLEERVIFVYPNDRLTVDNCRFMMGDKEAIAVDLKKFCNNMISSVRIWEKSMHNNLIFIKNYKNLITIHPEGISPYIVGFPIIG